MTVARLREEMSEHEFLTWQIYHARRAQQQELQQQRQQQQQRLGR